LSSVDGTAGDFPETDKGLWGKSVTHVEEPNREAESSGPPLAEVGAASGSGDDRPSACSRSPRQTRKPPDHAGSRHPVSRASKRARMPPGCGVANKAIPRAKICDTGSTNTGSAGYNGAGGATGGGEGVSAIDGAGGATVLMVVRSGIQVWVPKICTPTK
jgi:hypothetical protein